MPRIAGPCAVVIFGVTGDLATQEADAGDLRPGQPRAAAADVRADRVRPAGLGRRGLRRDRPRRGQGARPHAVPPGGLGPAGRGNPLRAGHLRRRRRVHPAVRHAGTSWTPSAAPAAITRSTCRSRRRRSRRCCEQLSKSGLANKPDGCWSRVVIEKPFGHDLESAESLNSVVNSVFPESVGVPHRPLPRQGDRAEHPGAAVRQRVVRPDLERPLRRPRPDHHGRGHRPGRPRRLLRRYRRGPRRDPESPAAAAGAHRDGGAGQLLPRRTAGREDQGALGHPAGRTAGREHVARPVHRRLAGRREGGRPARRGGLLQDLHHRDVRRDHAWRSTPAAGPVCRSTCGPENGWAAGSPRSP